MTSKPIPEDLVAEAEKIILERVRHSYAHQVQAFARALLAERDAATKAERERAAKLADDIDMGTTDERHRDTAYWAGFDDACTVIAAAIRGGQ